MKKLVTVLMALVFVVAMTACTAPVVSESSSAGTQTTTAAETTAQASDDQIVVGFANIAETAYQHTKIKESMQKEADARGWKLIYMNNALDGQTAVSNATQMLQMGIDYMIEYNVDISVAPTIMEAMNAANVPVIAVDIEHEGAIYFGADNYNVGPIVGEYTGNLVKAEWGEADCMLIVEDSISGETVLARTDNIVDGYRKIFPDFPDDKVFKVDGGTDTTDAQGVVAYFLSAHPDMHKIVICPAHVTYRLGASAAIETAGREKDCMIVSQGEYDYLDYLENTPDAPEWEVYRASLVYDFQNYGKYCFAIIDKLVAGEPTEDYYYPTHYMIDRTNVMDTFASYFEG
jgi:ABC-type sugar transport system substrate-binding protein